MPEYNHREAYLRYREIARLVYGRYDRQMGKIEVSEHAHVIVKEDGAYVEATVFVPKKWYTDSVE